MERTLGQAKRSLSKCIIRSSHLGGLGRCNNSAILPHGFSSILKIEVKKNIPADVEKRTGRQVTPIRKKFGSAIFLNLT